MRKFLLLGIVASSLAGTLPAAAQAIDPFIGETFTFAGNFCPTGWAPMDGRLMAISDNDVLFNLIGTTYGGDGATTFGLPTVKPIVTATGATFTQCISLFGIFPSQN